MTRKLKALGLALVAVLAMSAMATAAAQAATPEFHTEEAATIKGKGPLAGHTHYFKFTNELNKNIFTECPESELAGTTLAKTVTSLTLAPTYNKCKTAGMAAEFKPNECDFVVQLVAGSVPPTATFDIVCPGKNEITIEDAVCTIHIEPQTGLKHILLGTNTEVGAKRDVDAVVEIIGLKYTITTGCPFQNKNETRSDGRYTEEVTLQAFKAGGAQQGLWVE